MTSYTSMNLHYSQTMLKIIISMASLIPLWIYITLKLIAEGLADSTVLYLYEFTLLSNCHSSWYCTAYVLYLYEFTLLSNAVLEANSVILVLYLYEFTLLSNSSELIAVLAFVLYLYEFTLLSNWCCDISGQCESYTSMNLHYSQTMQSEAWKKELSYTSMNLHYSQTSTLPPNCS